VATANTFSTATSYTVTGLTSSSGYRFEVAAINGVGTGGWSAASAPVTPILDPTAPVGLVAVAGNASAALSWKQPRTGTITGYRIEAQEGSTTIVLSENTGTTATTYQATGLVNGKTYRFRAAAIDQTAVGPFSELSNAVVPMAPSSVTAVQVLEDLVITVSGGATAYFRTNAAGIEVAANRAFSFAQQFNPATVTSVIVSGNTGTGGFVFTTGILNADIGMSGIGSIAFETAAAATGAVQAALTTGPLLVSTAIRGFGGVTLNADLRLANDVEIDGGTGSVTFTGTVDGQSSGGQSLTVTALGTTNFEEAVGATVPLKSLETRATRPLVLSTDTSQSRTIPLHYLPYTTSGGLVEDKYGIEVAIGNNPARMYEFDTGGTGFWAGYNPEWWQGVVPSANAALMENKYTSGNFFDGLATSAVLTLGSGSEKVSTGGAVQITAITAGGNTNTGATFDFSTASMPPIEGHFFGDFGASFGIAKPAGGQVDPPVQVTNPLLQLPGNLSSGFVVQLGPLGTSPRVVVGITDELRGQFSTAIPLTEIDGLLYPNPNGAAFQRQAYQQFAFSGQYKLSRNGGADTADLGTIQTLIDSGAPTMTIHYPDSTPPGLPFLRDGMVTSGTTFTGVFPQGMGVPPFNWSFVAGSEASVNAIAFTPNGSAASPTNSVNTGLNFYNGYDVMFDVATGYLRLRPNGGLSSVQVESVTTLGAQRYGQNATLSGTYSTGGGGFSVAGATTLADAVTISAGTGAVTFSGSVDSAAGGAQPLTVQSGGETRFVRPVGGIRPLASLTTDAGGSTAAVSVTTVGAQRFNDAAILDGVYTTSNALFAVARDATLAGVVTVETTGPNGNGSGGAIQFGGRIDSEANTAFPLVLDAGDASITVTGIVGASRPVGGITIQAAKSAAFAAAVHLDGSGFGAAADGLVVADQVTVRLSAGGSIRRFTGSGVVFDKESQQSHLRGFEITDNVYDGIQIVAKSAGGLINYSGTVIEGNAIHGNGAFGIEVAGPVKGLTIRDNAIGREGVTNPWNYVSGGPNTHGIVLAPGSYAGTTINDNTIRFNRRSGIMMPGGVQGVAISRNVLERNTAHGIEAATGDFTDTKIHANTIRLNGGDGISLGAGIGQGTTAGGNPQTGYSAAVGHYLVPYANSPNFYDTTNPPADPTIAMQVGTKQLAVNMDTGSRGLYFDALQLDPNIVLDGPKGHVFLNSSNRLYFGQWSTQTITFTQSSFQGPSGPPDPTRKAQANVPVLVVTAIGASTTPAPGATVANTTFGTTSASGSITITNGSLKRTVGIVPNVTGSGPAGTVTIPGGWWANYADNMTSATTSKLAPVANFGIGLDRSGQGTAPTTGSRNQLYNAFLNLTEMQAGTMRPGYVISATGVTLGLDSTVSGFASTDLAPTGLPQGSQSAPDWQPATGTVEYQGTTSGTGQIVIDMGIPFGILTLPGKKPSAKFGGTMTVNLLNSNGSVRYGIDTSNANNLLNPTDVSFFNPLPGTYTENLPPQSAQFFNTGRKVFAAFDYLYDAAAGLLGLKVGSTTAAQNAFAGNGQFTAAHYANPNAPAGVTNLKIGGDAARHGNVITANIGSGITVNGSGSLGNAILSNSIFANGGLGIDLTNGGNAEQVAPVLAPALRLVGEKTVALTGTLATTAGYSGTYRLQFFSTPFADSPSAGSIEGRTLLGEIPAASASAFTATFPRGAVGLGDWITVTATPNTSPLNTSEFSSATRIMTLVVDTTADAGTGTLRSAMTLANANPGSEVIEFGIAATPRTIAVRTPLPVITGGMAIDGRTQPVTVSGANLRAAANGFTVAATAPLTEIRSLTITGFARGSGIWSAAANALFDGNTLRGNFNGISLVGGPGTQVSGNTITASRNWGVYATGGLAGARIESNTITSTVLVGVYLQNATGIAVGRAGAGNVITGGTARGLYSTGIYVAGLSTGSRLQANTVSGNGSGVMLVGARGVLVGGTTDADRNTITGNRGYGLFATGNSTGSIVQRNVISGNGRNVFTARASRLK
jgi:parallel beta-helix repeat protein